MPQNTTRDVQIAIRTLQGAGFMVMWEAPCRGGRTLHRFTAVSEGRKWKATGENALAAALDLMEQVELKYPD